MNIHTFVRHCNVSANSVGKNRPGWFEKKGREICWHNLNRTADDFTNITVVFDGDPDGHFVSKFNYNRFIFSREGGNDAKAFKNLLEYVYNQCQTIPDDDIIYITEDDYLHAPDWTGVIREAFDTFNVDFVTLYDHNDKYWLPMYEELTSKILASKSCHWRIVPNTTNTYACRRKTFMKYFDIQMKHCEIERGYTNDFLKFKELWEVGSNLISSIPGYSTHCETEYMSPVTDWMTIAYKTGGPVQ